MYIPTESTMRRSTVVFLTMWMKVLQSSSATWSRSSSVISTASKHGSSLLMRRRQDGKLPFLDVCLCREPDEFITSYSTSVYQKATHTNQYLPFYLHHPVVHKVAVVRTLMIQCTIIKWCGACGRREGNCGHTEGEWLYPLSFFHRLSHCI